jgi:CBS domain-containing protein
MTMATVREYMNPELVYVREGDRPELALYAVLEFGLTTVAVLDEDHMPVGAVALRDVIHRKGTPVRIAAPAVTIDVDAPIERAARTMAEAGVHHLVVVDDEGRAAGMLSALDCVRAFLGMAAAHPAPMHAAQ